MAIYRVHFDKITHDRKRGTYECSPVVGSVLISDYSLTGARDYAEAAFAKRPDLRGEVSAYRVFELEHKWQLDFGWRLTAKLFCSGNDSAGCRRFWQ